MNIRHLRRVVIVVALSLLCLAGCHSAFWSPDGKTIALDVDGKLRLFDVATGRFTSLATQGRYVINPTWSPDGKTLAYYGGTPQGNALTWHIWLRDVAANRERQLAGYEARGERSNMAILTGKSGYPLASSPDGQRLAALDVDTKTQRTCMKLFNLKTGHVVTVPSGSRDIHYPQWSPDGKRLAYTVESFHAVGHEVSPLDLYIADRDGRHGRRVWNSKRRPRIWPFEAPTWSSDGTGLMALTTRPEDAAKERFWNADTPQQVWLVPANGRRPHALLRMPTSIGMVLPDRSAATYLGGKDHLSLVYRFDGFARGRTLDTLAPTSLPGNQPLTEGHNPGATYFLQPYPVLSPNGKTIALAPLFNPKTKGYELRLYDVATGQKRVYPIP